MADSTVSPTFFVLMETSKATNRAIRSVVKWDGSSSTISEEKAAIEKYSKSLSRFSTFDCLLNNSHGTRRWVRLRIPRTIIVKRIVIFNDLPPSS